MDGNNVSGGGAGAPKWQMNLLSTYTVGPAVLSLETRYIEAGLFDATLIGPGQAGYNVNLPNSINNNHVAGAVYVNLGPATSFRSPSSGSLEVSPTSRTC